MNSNEMSTPKTEDIIENKLFVMDSADSASLPVEFVKKDTFWARTDLIQEDLPCSSSQHTDIVDTKIDKNAKGKKRIFKKNGPAKPRKNEKLKCRLCQKMYKKKHVHRHTLFHLSRDKKINRYVCTYCGYGHYECYNVKKSHGHGSNQNFCEDLIDKYREDAMKMSFECFGIIMFEYAKNSNPSPSDDDSDSESKKRRLAGEKWFAEADANSCSQCGCWYPRRKRRVFFEKNGEMIERYTCKYCGYENDRVKFLTGKQENEGPLIPPKKEEEEKDEVAEDLIEENMQRFLHVDQEDGDIGDSIVKVNYNGKPVKLEVYEDFAIDEDEILVVNNEEKKVDSVQTKIEVSETKNDSSELHRILKTWDVEQLVSHFQTVADELEYPKAETDEILKIFRSNRISGLSLSFEDRNLTSFFERCEVFYGIRSAIMHVFSLMKFEDINRST